MEDNKIWRTVGSCWYNWLSPAEEWLGRVNHRCGPIWSSSMGSMYCYLHMYDNAPCFLNKKNKFYHCTFKPPQPLAVPPPLPHFSCINQNILGKPCHKCCWMWNWQGHGSYCIHKILNVHLCRQWGLLQITKLTSEAWIMILQSIKN